MIVHRKVEQELKKRLVARAETMRIGPGWDPATDLGPVINREALDKIHAYTGIGVDEGASLLTGGEAATGGTSQAASTTGPRSSPMSSRGCGSPRRRSSGRRLR